MSFYTNRNVLVTGGTGLIGQPLVKMLVDKGANITVVSLDDPDRVQQGVNFARVDLREFSNCITACENMDMVFQLAGVKGSPAMTAKRPASFFVPTITFNTNMMEAARLCGVKRYLFTSTIGVYSLAEVFCEDDVWKTFPSVNDKFAGWAKRMGELQAEAYRIEYDWNDISIVRPANVYGTYDNFDPGNAMVIPSLIKRALDGEDPLVVWGDGSAIRDFVHARDVASGMLLVMEKEENRPVNIGSGVGCSIKEIVDIIISNMKNKPKVVWDTSKPSGDKKRLMDITRAKSIGFKPDVPIEKGISEVMEWYQENKDIVEKRYNVFRE